MRAMCACEDGGLLMFVFARRELFLRFATKYKNQQDPRSEKKAVKWRAYFSRRLTSAKGWRMSVVLFIPIFTLVMTSSEKTSSDFWVRTIYGDFWGSGKWKAIQYMTNVCGKIFSASHSNPRMWQDRRAGVAQQVSLEHILAFFGEADGKWQRIERRKAGVEKGCQASISGCPKVHEISSAEDWHFRKILTRHTCSAARNPITIQPGWLEDHQILMLLQMVFTLISTCFPSPCEKRSRPMR